MTTPDTARCEALGELKVNGETIATMRCSLEPGHDLDSFTSWNCDEYGCTDPEHRELVAATPHRASFEWTEPRLHYPSLVIDE